MSISCDDEQRRIFSNAASDLQTAEGRMFTQIESTFKWLMATLRASNGGALAACLGAEQFATRIGPEPLACFSIGLVLSLVMGLVNLLYAAKSLEPITELKNVFVIGSTVGEFEPAEVERLTKRIKRSTIFKWPLWASGIGSLALFVAGLMIAAGRIW